jgi:L-amino acid N-acyltransferase YncA
MKEGNKAAVRIARLTDLARIVEIYNQAILSQNATGDTIPFSVESRLEWFTQHTSHEYPVYVCEASSGFIKGYACLSPYRDRPAMARTAEISYYVDYTFHGQGIGSTLMEYALSDCVRIGKKVLLAIVLEWNESSITLLEKYGFEKWGYLPEVAELSGKLCGHLYYGRKIISTSAR